MCTHNNRTLNNVVHNNFPKEKPFPSGQGSAQIYCNATRYYCALIALHAAGTRVWEGKERMPAR